ncbi:MAG: PAS domain S-box protein [Planctomycetota bacterium]
MQNEVLLEQPQEFPGARLDSSEMQLRRVLDVLPVAAYTCDPSGLITYFNSHAEQLWGRAPKLNDAADRFCGSFKLFASDGSPISHDQCWMARALQTGNQYNAQEIVLERPNGTRATVLAHANPLRDDAGKLLCAVNVLIDINDRKQGEVAQAQLAAIVQSSTDAIIGKSLDGRILSWNAAAEQLFGYAAKEAVGSSIMMIIPPERIDEERSILSRLRLGERIEHFETERVGKQGQRIDISLTVSPILNGAGQIIGASKIARDITPRKQADKALLALKDELAVQLADLRRLHEMSVRLSTTLELHPLLDEILSTATAAEGTDMGLLSLCDSDQEGLRVGASLGFNEEYLKQIEFVKPGEGAYGRCYQEHCCIIIEDVDTDPAFEPYRDVARSAGIKSIHCTPLITRSGRLIGVLSTHFRTPHRPTDREIHLCNLCARQAVDFIENARLYVELRQADQRKDEFLATLAHELRNPLAPLSNSLQILALSKDLSPTVVGVREIMERQVGHMVRLVDDLLEVSRITRGNIELRREPIPLTAVLTNAIEISRPIVDRSFHQLNISVPPEPVILDADACRLAQVFANLINNAAKYTPEGGKIWVNARVEGPHIAVSVRDSGMGIPPDMLHRVFDMFAQIDRTRRHAQGGLGIGLTLAKRLVEMHQGQIEARSAGVGHGSEFTVRLPISTKAEVPPVEEISPILSAPSSENSLWSRRVLIVDDTRAAAYVLGKLLQTMGQQVETVDCAQLALEHVRRQPPHLIISDITMPDIDGYELARMLRREPGLEQIPLVALTGHGEDRDRQRTRDAGFDHHLVKPVSLTALRDLLMTLPPLYPSQLAQQA